MSNILVVDNEHRVRDRIIHFFQGNGHSVHGAESIADAVTILQERNIEVIIIDADINAGTLSDIIRITHMDYEHTQVIAITDSENLQKAVMSVREGAFDYLQKPYSVAELYLKVEKALEVRRLKLEAQNLRGEQPFIYRVNEFIGESAQLKELLKSVGKVARADSSVLLYGEHGTGKELIGGLIHYNSYRKKNAFVRVNCAALDDELLDVELFGHERDAFIGADNLRIGKLEQADGGSLYLSDISAMSLETQEKLMGFLTEGTFVRAGNTHPISVNVRLICSTTKDLKKEVEEGRFREDLYGQLEGVCLALAPLRERRDDIYPLVQFFIKKYAPEMNKKVTDISPKALELLYSYSWPGNVRELRNAVERAVIAAEGESVEPEDLTLEGSPAVQYLTQNSSFTNYNLEVIEKKVIESALRETAYIQKNAADLLGISRRALNYKIQKHGLRHASWRRNT
ncbi:MAG: sigma-54-dependent Fis family transcriptional regulator [Spirochaetales bacterium]|nr:sigma-54-dependent Fis family transcriptional regulator [Spirochaetales bacterium]